MTRQTPKEILAHNAGALLSRRCRATGTVVTLYANEDANLDTDDGPYSTVCEEHGEIVNHATYRAAVDAMPDAQSWCEECQAVSR